MSEEGFRLLISEIDQNENGVIEIEEFLQVKSIKSLLSICKKRMFAFSHIVNECN